MQVIITVHPSLGYGAWLGSENVGVLTDLISSLDHDLAHAWTLFPGFMAFF